MLSLSLGILTLVLVLACTLVGLILAIIGIPLAIIFHLVLPTAALLYGIYLIIRALTRPSFLWTDLIPGAAVLAIWYILWH